MPLRPDERADFRRDRYKVAVNADEGRRRREDNMVEIRKNKREQNLQKKRREMQPQMLSASTSSPVIQMNLEVIPPLVAGVLSDDISLQIEATTNFRKILAADRSPPIEEVIQCGVVPRFVEFLARDDFPQLQFEAAWALTNIASGTSDHTSVIIAHRAVPLLVNLMSSPCENVREQAVWALGNIAGDSTTCRDFVLSHGALPTLLGFVNEHAKLSMLRIAAWTLSTFCRGKPHPPFEQMKLAFPALRSLIHLDDQQVLIDACWAISCLSDGSNYKIQTVIEYGFCPRLVELLVHPSALVLRPALRTVGNIVTGDNTQTQVIINHQALPRLFELLHPYHHKIIQKEACWTISNITAGNMEQIQAVIEARIVTQLVHLLQFAEFDIKKEAAWAIINVISGGSHDQIKHVVDHGCIPTLCNLLICPDLLVNKICLEGLEHILKVGEAEKSSGGGHETNIYVSVIEQAGGMEKIENLQFHENIDIYQKAIKILETYWLNEDEKEDLEISYVIPELFHF